MLRKLLFFTIVCCLCLPAAWAAQYVEHGEHRIHYTTFSSLIIPADVASLHGIVRSENRIVLNLSVLKREQPVAAIVSGHVTNLLNQRFELTFDEIKEAAAIYYLASHIALAQDILTFTLAVELNTPAPIPAIIPITFVRRYD